MTQVNTYHKLWKKKTFDKLSRSYMYWAFVQILGKIVSRICFWRNLSTSLLLWPCLQTKEGKKCRLENSYTPSTSKVWPSDHREEYRSCSWPFYSPVQIFALWLTRRWGLYDGTFPNLIRGEKTLTLVPSIFITLCGCVLVFVTTPSNAK